MNIPDYVSPIIGYRAWGWNASGLTSLNGEPWPLGRPLRARCKCGATHNVPERRCTCGVYAVKNLDNSIPGGWFGIFGEVYLWGTIVEHAFGWRAQFAYPKSIVVSFEMIPAGLKEAQSCLEALLAYGVDTFIAEGKHQIPVWRKGRGYDAAGLDYMRKVATGEIVATVPIAFLTEDPRRHVLLQSGVQARHSAEIVFTDTRFSLNALDPITAVMKDPRVKVVFVDLRPENFRLSNYVVGLVRFAGRDRDTAIFVRSDKYTALNLRFGLNWADEYLSRTGRYDVQPAYERFIRRRTKASPSRRSAPPGGNSGARGLPPPPPILVHTVWDLFRIFRCTHHRWPEHWTLATAV